MRTPPADVTDDQVLATVREMWRRDVTAVTYLTVGFGAHHWRAHTAVDPALFLSLDLPNTRHSPGTLERVYATTAALAARGLEFVHPSVPTSAGMVHRACRVRRAVGDGLGRWHAP